MIQMELTIILETIQDEIEAVGERVQEIINKSILDDDPVNLNVQIPMRQGEHVAVKAQVLHINGEDVNIYKIVQADDIEVH